ncbi:MAG TPA: hypothetical protein VFN25_07675 [Dokdonella sp.]|uniref:hypothetical protein n=1 Tax=Dokdonella sp. TaxID=2291710 RepID=UPI002D7F844D|nr:hypothetical protein [Dokdonella sp.]HET9032768.1 hypothetical protein [Dokdonella sp.]
MNNPHLIAQVLLATLIGLLIPSAQAATPVSSDGHADGKAAKHSLREVEYSALENKIGSRLVIQTTNDTTRSGTLQRYTTVGISVKLGADQGSIELSIPRDTIRKVMLEIAPADPLFSNETSPHEGKPGAKKN